MKKFIASFLLGAGMLQAAPQVADGFKVEVFAQPPNISSSTSIAVAANGTIYASRDDNSSLSTKANSGSIIKIEDTDKDGKADKFTKFVENIDSPRGSCFVNETLYVVHPPFLSSFRDTNGDGKADEHKVLVKKLGLDLAFRGADHTSNGVRMGIDGWLYMAIGDYGIIDGEGTDGNKITLWGGGVVRCRPDGTELEIFSSNTRNIYDLAISPLLDIFTRDNTNDGKGWNTRFHHVTNLTDMGYPRLYQNFSHDHTQPIADFGGGSGTGGYFLQEPGFPEEYNNKAYTCDFTTGHIYYHPMERYEATFTTGQKSFFKPGRAIDMDADGNSQIFACDWNGGQYRYKANGVGKIYRITYPGLKAAKMPDLSKANSLQLVKYLESASAVCRINAQRALIDSRKNTTAAKASLIKLANKKSASIETRVAAIFALEQIYGKAVQKELIAISKDKTVREFTIRALTSRKSQIQGLNPAFFIKHLNDKDARVQLQATIALTKLKATDATERLLELAVEPENSGIQTEDEKSIYIDSKKRSAYLELSLKGKKKIFLYAFGGHNGNKNDFANWINPTLSGPKGKLPLTLKMAASATAFESKMHQGKNANGKAMSVKKKIYNAGFGVHADSTIVFDIPAGYDTFNCKVASDDQSFIRGNDIVFTISTKVKSQAVKGHPRLHLTARRALQIINNHAEILKNVGTDKIGLAALNTLKTMHQPKVVNGLITLLENTETNELKKEILSTLFRLYLREGERQGTEWWTTRPNDDGPYFTPVRWEMSAVMKAAIEVAFNKLPKTYHSNLLNQMQLHQIDFDEFKLSTKRDKVTVLLKKDILSTKDIQDLAKLIYKGKYLDKQAAIFQHMGSIHKAAARQSLSTRFDIAQQVINGKTVSDELKKAVDNFLHDPNLLNQYRKDFNFFSRNNKLAQSVHTYLLNLQTMPLVQKKTKALASSLTRAQLGKKVQVVVLQLIGKMNISGFEKELKKLTKNKKFAKVASATLTKLSKAKELNNGKKMSEFTLEEAKRTLKNVTGKISLGKQLFARQGCIACHATSQSEMQKGPYMGNVGGAFSREYILESILAPNKILSQGFATVTLTLTDGSIQQGFVSKKTKKYIEMRNLFGQLTQIPLSKVKKEHEGGNSMMPSGLVNTLTVKEFASLLDYLSSLK
ncbi:MAG: NPCBM/NEW2 domain-containing protein [Lentisphaeraceae bacterium]|nr:NPCBM/NEW2 domain-containing protein [Lentisphaeraceae bacterium]